MKIFTRRRLYNDSAAPDPLAVQIIIDVFYHQCSVYKNTLNTKKYAYEADQAYSSLKQ